MPFDTTRFPSKGNLQGNLVNVHLQLTGAGAAAPTIASTQDFDNRIVNGVLTRTGAGDYTVTLSQIGRVLEHASACLLSPATGTPVWLGSATLSGSTVRFKLFGTAGATDIASNDLVSLRLVFKDGT